MATFFGEVLPFRSRAVDDEDDGWDDEETIGQQQQEDAVRFVWTIAPDASSATWDRRLLTIGIGPIACAFLKLQIADLERPMATAVREVRRTDDDGEKTTSTTAFVLYRKTDATVVGLHENACSDEDAFSFAHELLSKFSVDRLRTMVLCSQHESERRLGASIADARLPTLRCLKTSSWTDAPAAPYLERPNLLGGLAAAVATQCLVRGVPVIVYVSYVDVRDVDSLNVGAFRPLLDRPPLSEDFETEATLFLNVSKSRGACDVSTGNLYA